MTRFGTSLVNSCRMRFSVAPSGVERNVRATDDGIEPIFAGAQNVAARHYAVTSELLRDVWYGPDGQTVQVLFPAKDGSEIAFVMRAPSQRPLATEQRASSSSVRRAP